MSVTDSFRLLNNTIRQTREDRRNHQERMAMLEQRKAEEYARLNSPEARLSRQKAERQLEVVQFDNKRIAPGEETFKKEIHDTYVAPAIKAALPADAEYLDGVGVVKKGTNQPYSAPRHLMEKINEKVDLAVAMSGRKSNQLLIDRDRHERSIKNLEKNTSTRNSGDRHRLIKNSIRVQKEKLDEVNTKLNDPTYMARVYAGDIMAIEKAIQTELTSDDVNMGLVNHLQGLLNETINNRNAVANPVTEQKAILYELDEDGNYVQGVGGLPMYMSKENINKIGQAGHVIMGGKIYTTRPPKEDDSPGSTSLERAYNEYVKRGGTKPIEQFKTEDWSQPRTTMTQKQGIDDINKRIENGEFGFSDPTFSAEAAEHYKKQLAEHKDPSIAHTKTLEFLNNFNQVNTKIQDILSDLETEIEDKDRIGPFNKEGYDEAVKLKDSIDAEFSLFQENPIKYINDIPNNVKSEIKTILEENGKKSSDANIALFYIQNKDDFVDSEPENKTDRDRINNLRNRH